MGDNLAGPLVREAINLYFLILVLWGAWRLLRKKHK